MDTVEEIKCHYLSGNNDSIHSPSLACIRCLSFATYAEVLVWSERDVKIFIPRDDKNTLLVNNS